MLPIVSVQQVEAHGILTPTEPHTTRDAQRAAWFDNGDGVINRSLKTTTIMEPPLLHPQTMAMGSE